MKLRRLFAALAIAALFVPAVQAGEAKIGNVTMNSPEGWKVDQDPDAKADRPSLRMQPASGKDFLVLVTPFQLDANKRIDAQGVRNLVDSVAATTGPRSVERKPVVQEFRSATVQGYYFTATDAAPKEGEWKYMTQGIMLVGKQAVGFTVLTMAKDSRAPAQALEMLRGAHAP